MDQQYFLYYGTKFSFFIIAISAVCLSRTQDGVPPWAGEQSPD